MDHVSLLLPGFQDRTLQARVLAEDVDATTYLITCPGIVPGDKCGILGQGVTAISASKSVQIINIDQHDNTALVSCEITGTTSAFCRAKETISVQGTLAPKDLNWMNIPLTETPPLPSSIPMTKPVTTHLVDLSTPSWKLHELYTPSQILSMCFLRIFGYFTVLFFIYYNRLRQ